MFGLSKLLFIISLAIPWISITVSGQATCTVKYIYKKSEEMDDSFHFKIIKPSEIIRVKPNLFSITNILYSKLNSDSNENICTFDVADTSCAMIWDGFGLESFVIPGDTIEMYIEKKQKSDDHFWINKSKNYRSVWFHNYVFKGKNKYIYSLFDSLAYNTGELLHYFIGIQKANYTLNSLYLIAYAQYNERRRYLESYCNSYNIPDNIKRMAQAEIYSAYITTLLLPMHNIINNNKPGDYPSEYLKSIDSFYTYSQHVNSRLFFKTFLYSSTVYQYISTYKVKYKSQDSTEEKLFQLRYSAIDSASLFTKEIKNFLLSYCLFLSVNKNYPSFKTFFTDYKELSPDRNDYRFLDSLYMLHDNKPVSSYLAAMNGLIVDKAGKMQSIKSILGIKPVVMDCWASWCGPCLLQMPYEKKLEIKYADKVKFIYISFDKNDSSWKSKSKDLNLNKNDYLLKDNFKSDFAYFFNIESIPHYLIFDKAGNLVNNNAPRPSLAESYDLIIDKLLNQQ